MTLTKSAQQEEIDAFYRQRLADPSAAAPAATPPLSPDYAAGMLAALPPGVVGSSFGCGNPVAFAGVQPGDTVLDLGCGAGLDLLVAADRVGPRGRVIGVDMNEDLIARARDNARQAGAQQVEIHAGMIEALPIADQTVDWVISNCVINLSADKPAVFAEILRVLRPGGQVLISDLVADNLPDWVDNNSDLYAACIAGAVSETTYCALADAAGLADVRIVDRMVYDAGMVRVLIESELPVALGAVADRMGKTCTAMLDFAATDLAGRIQSIKLAARRPG